MRGACVPGKHLEKVLVLSKSHDYQTFIIWAAQFSQEMHSVTPQKQGGRKSLTEGFDSLGVFLLSLAQTFLRVLDQIVKPITY